MPRPAVAPPRPTYPPPDEPQRLNLSLTQVVATALAALTATVVASFLGVAGTVIGAVLASVCSVVGTAVYSHSLRRTRERVRAVVPARRPVGPRQQPPAEVPAGWAQPTYHAAGRARTATPERTLRRSRAARLAIATTGAFVALLACITGVEAVAHRPLSDLVRNESGSGTTFFGGSHRAPTSTSRTATPTSTAASPTSHAATTGPAGRPSTATPPAPTVTRTVTTTPSRSATPTRSAAPSASATAPTSAQPQTAGAGATRG
jgi:hypothetical protein